MSTWPMLREDPACSPIEAAGIPPYTAFMELSGYSAR